MGHVVPIIFKLIFCQLRLIGKSCRKVAPPTIEKNALLEVKLTKKQGRQ